MGKNKLTKIKDFAPKKEHEIVIDEYFNNGFNATKAAQTIYPNLSYSQAANMGSLIMQAKRNKAYIQSKQNELRREANISPAEIAKELKNIAFADITEFIGKSEEEIKQLHPSVRRTLSKINIKHRNTVYKDGTETQETNTIYSIPDRLKALDMLAKYIGFYEADNKQKANQINVLQLLAKESPEALNSLEKVLQSIEISESN